MGGRRVALAVVLGWALLAAGCSSSDGGDGSPTGGADFSFLAGEWKGTWTNATFGSTGSVTATFAFDAGGTGGHVTVDVGGNAFGTGDPPPMTLAFAVAGDTLSGSQSGTPLGTVAFTIDKEGRIDASATDIPGPAVSATFTGTSSATEIAITYRVLLAGGASATGTARLVR